MTRETQVFTGRITQGRLKVRGWKALELRDGQVLITIERARATRSQLQNAWYWSKILPILSDETGHTVDELHEICKLRFNSKRLVICDHNGEMKGEERIGLSTTKLNRLTFADYCERIREWAAIEFGLDIPDPDPNWRETQYGLSTVRGGERATGVSA
jgi:hypothetical protein